MPLNKNMTASKRGQRYGDGRYCAPISPKEKRADLKEQIKVDQCLIHEAEDLINPDSQNNLASYLKPLHEAAEKIKQRRRDLLTQYAAAKNGRIPELHKHIETCQEKLTKLGVDTGAVRDRKCNKVKDLREKIKILEQELYDATIDATFGIDNLMESIAE